MDDPVSYRVNVGTMTSDPMAKDKAEEIAERLWASLNVHTQVVDEADAIVCEFEI